MGKIRRSRSRLHLQAVKSEDPKEKEYNGDSFNLNEASESNLIDILSNAFVHGNVDARGVTRPMLNCLQSILPAIFPVKGLFGNLESSESKVEGDRKKQALSKSDKRKERHRRFLSKLNAGRVVEDTAKKAEERSRTVIVGDMHPMLSALPTVRLPDLKDGTASGWKKSSLDTKGNTSKKTRKKMQLADIEQFKQVLSHPAYKANPLGAISEHLKNAIHMEQENNTA